MSVRFKFSFEIEFGRMIVVNSVYRVWSVSARGGVVPSDTAQSDRRIMRRIGFGIGRLKAQSTTACRTDDVQYALMSQPVMLTTSLAPDRCACWKRFVPYRTTRRTVYGKAV